MSGITLENAFACAAIQCSEAQFGRIVKHQNEHVGARKRRRISNDLDQLTSF
jgi:hypothetical protein